MDKLNNLKKIIEKIIFSARWLLIPFYLGLMFALVCYLYIFLREETALIFEVGHLTINDALLKVLELLDIVMIANLIKMIITGSYNSFVSKTHGVETENIGSGMLKVKMGTSLIGVSSIHLLQVFINSSHIPMEELYKKLMIHGAFLLGGYVLAKIDYLHVKAESFEPHESSKSEIVDTPKH